MARIYCAGPFFNASEQSTMAQIATVIEGAGHQTYLAQRDGLEGGEVLKQISESIADQSHASGLLHRLVFSLDVYRLVEWADLVVANLNGRVPDEGTIVECALAWQANKPLVYFKDDWRAPFHGRDNLMLTCLTKGQITTSIEALPISIVHAVNAFATGAKSTDVALGRTLAECRQRISFESSISFQKLATQAHEEGWKLENC